MKRVFLCGASIFLTGLAGGLENVPDIQVTRRPALSGAIDLTDFDLVVVDFDEVAPADVLDILRARPDLKVVGVNARGGAVTVLSGKVYLARTLEEVVACLE
ncbi:MAG TPA: hypothetical protein ENN19_06255 [Chloroflexi bacterium]|nr:hypothetical protein [Chloroflexota bacterium]